MSWEKSACLSRMPDEVRLLQQAETITDYPTQLLRTVEDELEEYHRQLQACNDFLNRRVKSTGRLLFRVLCAPTWVI